MLVYCGMTATMRNGSLEIEKSYPSVARPIAQHLAEIEYTTEAIRFALLATLPPRPYPPRKGTMHNNHEQVFGQSGVPHSMDTKSVVDITRFR